MQVRVFEPVAGVSLVIVLNVATFQEYWRGILPALLERTIGVAGSIAAWGLDQQYHVGLIANGCPLLSDRPIKVPAGRTPGQLAALLEALARVTGFASTSIHTLLRRESPGLPLGAVLVVVTPIVSQELVATLATLRDAGRRLALVSLADDAPPALEGVVSYHIPPYSAGLRAAESNGEGMMTISRLSDLTASAR
jgi:uncharacterized protein (DUF58 family)